MNYAIALIKFGAVFVGYWHHPIHKTKTYPSRPVGGQLGSKAHPPLVFDTQAEAEVALDFFECIYGNHALDAEIRAVEHASTHSLSDEGFVAKKMGKDTLFG